MLAACSLTGFKPAHQAFGQGLIGACFKGGCHGRGNAFIRQDIADGNNILAMRHTKGRLHPRAMEMRRTAVPIQHRNLAPLVVRGGSRQRRQIR